jgi:hypothetical protein
MGLDPSVTGERNTLLRFVNEAALELYHISDMAGTLQEQYFKILPNQTIALPAYVGQVRAMRQAESQVAMKLSQLRPRYNEFNWQDEWRNYRLKGLQTLQTSLQNQSNVVLSVAAVENPPAVIHISGPSFGSAMLSETITMSSTSIQSVNQYLDVTSFTRTQVGQYDVVMSDIDGNQISYLASNQLRAQFQVLDISAAPWIGPLANGLYGWVEVLFKSAMITFQNDTDEFPAPGYDNVIVNKALQLWYEEQANPQIAMAYYQKANQLLAQIHEDANRGTDDVVSMCAFPHDKVTHRTGFGRDYYWAYRITGR